MDSSFTVKPRDSASRVVYDRTSIVRTDLSPAQSVRAADAAAAIRNGQQPPVESHARNLMIDPMAEDIVRHARDEEERRRRNKVPDEALSRMRAYRQPQSETDLPPDPDQPHADIEV